MPGEGDGPANVEYVEALAGFSNPMHSKRDRDATPGRHPGYSVDTRAWKIEDWSDVKEWR